MTARQLTSQNATITTASVQIKTLTVSGKQVTQAVFRQLREEPLITRDGYLNGTPWGYVNYHPDKCTDGYRPHRHIVWQLGEDLLRSRVDDKPDWFEYDGGIDPLKSCQFDDLLDHAALEWVLADGPSRKLPPGIVRKDQILTSAPGDRYASLYGRVHYWDDRGVRIAGKPSDEAVNAVELRIQERGWKSREDWPSSGTDFQRADEIAVERATKVQEVADAIRSELVDGYGSLDGVQAVCGEVIQAEAERRLRQTTLRTSLADLPQLFIAV